MLRCFKCNHLWIYCCRDFKPYSSSIFFTNYQAMTVCVFHSWKKISFWQFIYQMDNKRLKMCQTENNTYYVRNNFLDDYIKFAIIFWTCYINRWKYNISIIYSFQPTRKDIMLWIYSFYSQALYYILTVVISMLPSGKK